MPSKASALLSRAFEPSLGSTMLMPMETDSSARRSSTLSSNMLRHSDIPLSRIPYVLIINKNVQLINIYIYIYIWMHVINCKLLVLLASLYMCFGNVIKDRLYYVCVIYFLLSFLFVSGQTFNVYVRVMSLIKSGLMLEITFLFCNNFTTMTW
jgi:hypothetical protein